jgi:NAD(P)H-dependent flavin oxidoreductase YrpB (nitropropane dioxygenase family)
MLFDGGWPDAPHRTLRNSTVEAWERAGCPAPPARPGEGELVARGADGRPIQRYAADAPVADATGDVEALALYAGQSAGVVKHARSAAAIVQELVAGAASAISSAAARAGEPSEAVIQHR